MADLGFQAVAAESTQAPWSEGTFDAVRNSFMAKAPAEPARMSLLAGTRFYPEAPAPQGYVLAARREVATRYDEVCLDRDEECPVFALRVMCYQKDPVTGAAAGRNVGEILVVRLNGERGYANVAIASEVDAPHRRRGIATALYDWAEILWGADLEPYPGGLSSDAEAFWSQRLTKRAETARNLV